MRQMTALSLPTTAQAAKEAKANESQSCVIDQAVHELLLLAWCLPLALQAVLGPMLGCICTSK